MISEDMELPTFHEVSEVPDGEVSSQQFPIKGAVLPLSWSHLPRKVGDGAPDGIDLLL